MTKRAFVFRVPAQFATTAAARTAVWRRVAAVATALGWPRVPVESDVIRYGGGIHVPIGQLQRRVYWSKPRLIENGPLAGSLVLILDVDNPELAALDGQTLAVPATYDGRAVPGGAGNVTINLGAGVAIDRDHAGPEESPP